VDGRQVGVATKSTAGRGADGLSARRISPTDRIEILKINGPVGDMRKIVNPRSMPDTTVEPRRTVRSTVGPSVKLLLYDYLG